MIISVHMPKSGGGSFKELLENHFGSKFIPDYLDKPMNKPFEQTMKEVESSALGFENNINETEDICIHGHFLPYKYNSLLGKENVQFITWLRDPLERVASNYYFWKRGGTKNLDHFGGFRKKVIEENWSLEQFCFSKERQNIYTKYLYKFPVENFDFIGITEYFESEIEYFSGKYLNKRISNIPRKNINSIKSEPYFKDLSLINELKKFHSDDYLLYEFALQKRAERSKNIIT